MYVYIVYMRNKLNSKLQLPLKLIVYNSHSYIDTSIYILFVRKSLNYNFFYSCFLFFICIPLAFDDEVDWVFLYIYIKKKNFVCFVEDVKYLSDRFYLRNKFSNRLHFLYTFVKFNPICLVYYRKKTVNNRILYNIT